MLGEVWIFLIWQNLKLKKPYSTYQNHENQFDGLCPWPFFLSMKTLSRHSQPIHQKLALLFSFSNLSSFDPDLLILTEL
jgi:hypothetical protein